jgi:hypothetical protein
LRSHTGPYAVQQEVYRTRPAFCNRTVGA